MAAHRGAGRGPNVNAGREIGTGDGLRTAGAKGVNLACHANCSTAHTAVKLCSTAGRAEANPPAQSGAGEACRPAAQPRAAQRRRGPAAGAAWMPPALWGRWPRGPRPPCSKQAQQTQQAVAGLRLAVCGWMRQDSSQHCGPRSHRQGRYASRQAVHACWQQTKAMQGSSTAGVTHQFMFCSAAPTTPAACMPTGAAWASVGWSVTSTCTPTRKRGLSSMSLQAGTAGAAGAAGAKEQGNFSKAMSIG